MSKNLLVNDYGKNLKVGDTFYTANNVGYCQ